MLTRNQIQNKHLLWRAGFGISAHDIARLDKLSYKELYTQLSKASYAPVKKIEVANSPATEMMQPMNKTADTTKQKTATEQFIKIKKLSIEGLRNLNIAWMNEMVSTEAVLREKMSLFWHGHFACRVIVINYQQELLNVIRTNALGNFGDLLKAVSKSASMLQFLNNQQNRKQHPNENFAREVMELFTSGRGNYTEHDVKEAARAFTGWGFNPQGEFVFRQMFHDTGEKEILGKKGNFNGDDVLNILLEQPQTAEFITTKIYRYFINENVDEQKIKPLAKVFYDSGYNIETLMKNIFTSSWFYDEKNIGSKIKSPVELIAGIRQMLPMKIENDDVLLIMQKLLGQLLFYPPNVAGWPGGKSWIDSSTLMMRLRLPQLIHDDGEIDIAAKPDDDQQMGMQDNDFKKYKAAKNALKINASIDWSILQKTFAGFTQKNTYQTIEGLVLQTKQGSVQPAALYAKTNNLKGDDYMKALVIALMSTPEYQLC